jgi:hypothetical protein
MARVKEKRKRVKQGRTTIRRIVTSHAAPADTGESMFARNHGKGKGKRTEVNEDSMIGEYRTILICGGDAELSVAAT